VDCIQFKKPSMYQYVARLGTCVPLCQADIAFSKEDKASANKVMDWPLKFLGSCHLIWENLKGDFSFRILKYIITASCLIFIPPSIFKGHNRTLIIGILADAILIDHVIGRWCFVSQNITRPHKKDNFLSNISTNRTLCSIPFVKVRLPILTHFSKISKQPVFIM